MCSEDAVAPRRIDIITGASGLRFQETFERAMVLDVEGPEVRVPSIADLIRNQRASGRTKNLADAEAPEREPARRRQRFPPMTGMPGSRPRSTHALRPTGSRERPTSR